MSTSDEINSSHEPNASPPTPIYTYTERPNSRTHASFDNITRVDTGAMRETAAHVREQFQAIEEARHEIGRCLTALEGCWEGAAADEYIKAYRKLMSRLAEGNDRYGWYPGKLEKLAEVREQADMQATMYATSVETAVWVDV